MRLDEFLKLAYVVDLHEMFNTKVPIDKWETAGNVLIGHLTINNEHFTIELEPFEYQGHNAINIGFSKVLDGVRTQKLTMDSKNASSIIGAIINIADEKLNEFQYDAVVFLASDNVKQRMRIYDIAARQVQHKFSGMIPNIPLGGGKMATVLVGKMFPKEKLEHFKQHISTLDK